MCPASLHQPTASNHKPTYVHPAAQRFWCLMNVKQTQVRAKKPKKNSCTQNVNVSYVSNRCQESLQSSTGSDSQPQTRNTPIHLFVRYHSIVRSARQETRFRYQEHASLDVQGIMSKSAHWPVERDIDRAVAELVVLRSQSKLTIQPIMPAISCRLVTR